MGISLREYARRRGVSHVAVMKAIKVGRITPEPDGSLDPVKADAQWDDQTDPARRPEAPEDERTGTGQTPAASDSDKPGDEVAQVRLPAAIEPVPQGAATFPWDRAPILRESIGEFYLHSDDCSTPQSPDCEWLWYGGGEGDGRYAYVCRGGGEGGQIVAWRNESDSGESDHGGHDQGNEGSDDTGGPGEGSDQGPGGSENADGGDNGSY